MINRTAMLDQIDEHVGHRLQLKREAMRFSISRLAACVDLTEIELSDAEYGQKRLSASKLFALSKVLGVHVAYFFEDYCARQ